MLNIDDVKYVKNPKMLNGVVVINNAIEALDMIRSGHKVARFEFGNSMTPILNSGEYCILTPLKDGEEANIGDAVFCSVGGYIMTHMVLMKSKSAKDGKPFYLIGGSDLQIYGWTDKVYAIANGTRIFEKNDSYFEDSVELK